MGNQGLFRSICLYFLAATFLAACLPTSASSSSQTEPCVPPEAIVNPYRSAPDSWLWDIYNYSALPAGANGSTQYLQARYAAFKILGRQVKRWSSYVDITQPDSGNVRITVTYLAPQLLGTIELNQMLRNGLASYSQMDFENKVKEGMENIAKRNESLFLVTITSTANNSLTAGGNPITVDFPVSEMGLTNTANVTVYPIHDDHSLDQYNHLVDGNLSGFISYQLGVKNGDTCNLLLDPIWSTTISIHIPSLFLNGATVEQQTWTIRYVPPINDGMPAETPNYNFPDPMPDFNVYSPSTDIPTPLNLPGGDSIYWDEYWEAMGRYEWEKIMFTDLP